MDRAAVFYHSLQNSASIMLINQICKLLSNNSQAFLHNSFLRLFWFLQFFLLQQKFVIIHSKLFDQIRNTCFLSSYLRTRWFILFSFIFWLLRCFRRFGSKSFPYFLTQLAFFSLLSNLTLLKSTTHLSDFLLLLLSCEINNFGSNLFSWLFLACFLISLLKHPYFKSNSK